VTRTNEINIGINTTVSLVGDRVYWSNWATCFDQN